MDERPGVVRGTHADAKAVQNMFSAIAPRYDLVNHLLSFNMDRLWWWQAARTFREILSRPEARVLDLCCGTGFMTSALYQRARGDTQVVGADFAHPMLRRAAARSEGTRLRWVEADALHLPFPDGHFDLITAAFGFRNLADYDAGLREMVRVVRVGGECGILDFGEPKGLLGGLYRIYFRRVLPAVGTAISGVKGPYAYLPVSVERFPAPEDVIRQMRAAGFREAAWTPYTFGVAGLYRAKK